MTAYRNAALKARILLFLLFLLVFFSAPALAQTSPYELSLEAFRTESGPAPVVAVLFFSTTADRHIYGNTPGPSGFPTVITGEYAGQELSALYPPPVSAPDTLEPGLMTEQYTGRTLFFLPVTAKPGEKLQLSVQLSALLCSAASCQPLRDTLTLDLPAGTELPKAEDQDWWPQLAKAKPGVQVDDDADEDPAVEQNAPDKTAQKAAGASTAWSFTPRYFAPELEVRTLSKAAFLAFLAGLVLNFMPCVLPVITLKLRSFIPVADRVPQNQKRAFRAHNLFFALGIVLYFLVLSVIIAATGMVWGQIFQKPSAIITLTAVVFALSLSLFGVYDLPLIDLKGKATGVARHPRLESFVTGILATILATPCSGPFLGGVLAWALIQPPQIIALVLSCIGLGMASPYLVMAVFPRLYRLLPRPGAWTVHLERMLGFLLAGTCVYLMGLLPATQYLNVLILLWVIALAAWVWGQWTNLNQSTGRRWSIRAAGLALVALTAFLVFRPEIHADPWQPFEMSRFQKDLGQTNMLLDFTADWCPNCKFLEKTVLAPEKSAVLAKRFNATLLRVDLTRHDPELTALLTSLGSQSIPVLAVFSRENPESPLVLRDLFTGGQLEEALEAELRK